MIDCDKHERELEEQAEAIILRHNEKEQLMTLLMAQSHPEMIPIEIAKVKAKMEREDIESVRERFEQWLSGRGSNT